MVGLVQEGNLEVGSHQTQEEDLWILVSMDISHKVKDYSPPLPPNPGGGGPPGKPPKAGGPPMPAAGPCEIISNRLPPT